MDSFNGRSGFCYNPVSEAMADPEEDGFCGLLEIYVHHARNIHNICIYENQDVYAKFSLTYSPDEALSTRIVNGGGKNPEFDESLTIKIAQPDAVLKCEIWMFSRARNHMEDQLLGFALVPISSVLGKGKLTQDFTLSSTDLIHSPAGTVKLTLFLEESPSTSRGAKPFSSDLLNSSIASEVVLLDRKMSEGLGPGEYEQIEFPDISAAAENQRMVSEYFTMTERCSAYNKNLAGAGPIPFLRLGACSQSMDDYDMNFHSSEENICGSISTMTSLSDDRNSTESLEKRNHAAGEHSNSQTASLSVEARQSSPDTPTSRKGNCFGDKKLSDFSGKENESAKDRNHGPIKLGPVFTSPHGITNNEAKQAVIQQQIVDMYMRSMQQFTESLEKMKLPMDLSKPDSDEGSIVIQGRDNKLDAEKKKDGQRIFYGSRAFF